MLIATGYAIACSPGGPDTWFTLSVSIDETTLPKGFAIKRGRLHKTAARRCVFADGEALDGYELWRLNQFAKSRKAADNRPQDVEIPEPDELELETHCDRRRYVTRARLSYKPVDSPPARWLRHVEVELAGLEHLIAVRRLLDGPASGDLYLVPGTAREQFCMVSAQRMTRGWTRIPSPEVLGATNRSIALARLAGVTDHSDAYPETVETKWPPKLRTFDVYLDCYRTHTTVKARIDYALNTTYDPHAFAKAAELCNRLQ